MNIVLCASAAFYKHLNQIAQTLQDQGLNAVRPESAVAMEKSGNYDVASNKTWYTDPSKFVEKRRLIDGHFAKIVEGDAILVINDEKRGVPGYIGANCLMEMAIAYYHDKHIYVLNTIDQSNPVYEEVLGMNCTILDGDLSQL